MSTVRRNLLCTTALDGTSIHAAYKIRSNNYKTFEVIMIESY